MQTFLPYKDFYDSLNCLDYKRLGNQRVEAMQILNALASGSTSGWRNHPVVKMWKGFESDLALYHDLAIAIWVRRGFKNNMLPRLTKPAVFHSIPWLTEEFCASHRSNLLRKDPVWYGQFRWKEPTNLPYIWPDSVVELGK